MARKTPEKDENREMHICSTSIFRAIQFNSNPTSGASEAKIAPANHFSGLFNFNYQTLKRKYSNKLTKRPPLHQQIKQSNNSNTYYT